MVTSSLDPRATSELEVLNKSLVRTQARQINKELTRLKKISDPAGTKPALDIDKTGQFIVVPLSIVQGSTIDKAYEDAIRVNTDSSMALEKSKKKKKWFKWG